jgi:aspartate ammonia-lyase
VYDIVCDRGLMTREQLDQVLNPVAMTGSAVAGAAAAKR